MKTLNKRNASQKGSSIIIGLVVIVLVIFLLNHYGINFASVWASIKNFFGI